MKNIEIKVDGMVNVAAIDDDFHINVRITDEGVILDSYSPNEAELLGTIGMTWDEWADYIGGRNVDR